MSMISRTLSILCILLYVNHVLGCGFSTHEVVGERAAHFFRQDKTAGLDLYTDIVDKHPQAFQAGLSYPDWGYSCLLKFVEPSIPNGSEASHWNTFTSATIDYLNQNFQKPWNDDAQNLISFLFGVVAHDAADTLWHSLAGVSYTNNGFIPSLSYADYEGWYGQAHTAADFGGDIELFYTGDVPESAGWYIPTGHLVKIFEMMGFGHQFDRVILDLCNLQQYGEYLAVRELPVPLAYAYMEERPAFLVENYHSWWLGGVDDMATWSARCWKTVITSIETGVFDPCVILIKDSDQRNDTVLEPPLWPYKPQAKTAVTSRNDVNGVWLSAEEPRKPEVIPQEISEKIAKRAYTQDGWCGDEKNTHNSITYTIDGVLAELGASVAVGDFNNDGKKELAIGAPGYSLHGVAQGGAVFVVHDSQFRLPGHHNHKVEEVATHKLFGEIDSGRMGVAMVALDFNLDGFTDLIVSSPGKGSEDLSYTGLVTIYYGSSTGLNCLVNSTIDPLLDWTQLGATMFKGDIDGDGNDDVIIGAPHATRWEHAMDLKDLNRQDGQLWIYLSQKKNAPGSLWGPKDSQWIVSSRDPFAWFGQHAQVAIVEGRRLLIVGAPHYAEERYGEPLSSAALGKIWAFDVTHFPSVKKLWSIQGVTGVDDDRKFGWSFAIGNPFGGNSTDVYLLAGAPTSNSGAEIGTGVVQIIDIKGLRGATNLQRVETKATLTGHTQLLSRFGWNLGFADFNGDGTEDFFVTQPWHFNRLFSDVNDGAAYIWLGSKNVAKKPGPSGLLHIFFLKGFSLGPYSLGHGLGR